MPTPNRRLILLTFLGVFAASLHAAQVDNKTVGTVASPYLTVNPSVRMSALGGDQVAAHGDSGVLFSNPAGISTLQTPELWLTHNESMINTQYETLGVGLPMKNNVLGISAQYVNRGSTDRVGIDSSNQPILGLGTFRYTTTLLHFSLAHRLSDRWSFGVTGKGWQDSLDGQSTTGFAGDVGVLARNIFPSLDFGAAVRNVGPSVNGFALPRNEAAGIAYHLGKASLFSEVNHSGYQKTSIHAGLEYTQDILWLRGGFENQTNDLSDPLSKFSFGAGIRIKGWKIDYAWKPMGDLGDQHRIAITIGFGMTAEERERAAKELDHAMEKRIADHSNQSLTDGRIAMKHGDWENATSHFEKALAWDGRNTEALASLKLAKDKKNFADAQKLYQSGTDFANRGRWLEAASAYSETLKLVPNFEEAKKGLARADKKIRKAEGRTAADSEEQAYNQGVRYFLDGQYDKALGVWNRLLVTSPDRANVREYVEKAEKMKLQQEVASLKQNQVKQNGQSELLIQQGYTFFRLGQTDKAIATWERALALDPLNTDAKTALKEARAKKDLLKGNSDVASSKVEELNSEAMNAYVSGDINNAVGILRRAVALDPKNARVKNNLNRIESELASKDMMGAR